MIKTVNVFTSRVIRSLKGVPIRSNMRGIKLDTDDILTCITNKAKVEEILPNGKTILLNLANYNTVNYEAPAEKQTPKMEEPKVEEQPKVEEAPVVEETPAEEAAAPAEEAVVEEAAVEIAEVVDTEADPAEEVSEEAPVEETVAEEKAEEPVKSNKKTYGGNRKNK